MERDHDAVTQIVTKCDKCGFDMFVGGPCMICVIGSTPFVFWTCPKGCRGYVEWNADKTDATCQLCGCRRSDNLPVVDPAVCACGKPSIVNSATQQYVGCCEDCMPF